MFEEVARSIAQRLSEGGEDIITNERNNNRRHDNAAKEIQGILNGQLGEINLYPSDNRIDCCNKAVFLAIRKAFTAAITVNGAFRYAIEQFIQHMIRCGNITKNACIIAEFWDPIFFTKWEGSIRSLCTQYGATLEIYLIVNGNAHKILQINP